jgi:hypothetical protein
MPEEKANLSAMQSLLEEQSFHFEMREYRSVRSGGAEDS